MVGKSKYSAVQRVPKPFCSSKIERSRENTSEYLPIEKSVRISLTEEKIMFTSSEEI